MFKARFYCPLKEHYTLCAMYLCTMMNFMNETSLIEICTTNYDFFFLSTFALFSCQTSVDFPCAVHLNASVPAYNVCTYHLFACNFDTHHVRYRFCFATKLLRYLCERQIHHAYLKLNYCRLCINKEQSYQIYVHIFGKN